MVTFTLTVLATGQAPLCLQHLVSVVKHLQVTVTMTVIPMVTVTVTIIDFPTPPVTITATIMDHYGYSNNRGSSAFLQSQDFREPHCHTAALHHLEENMSRPRARLSHHDRYAKSYQASRDQAPRSSKDRERDKPSYSSHRSWSRESPLDSSPKGTIIREIPEGPTATRTIPPEEGSPLGITLNPVEIPSPLATFSYKECLDHLTPQALLTPFLTPLHSGLGPTRTLSP